MNLNRTILVCIYMLSLSLSLSAYGADRRLPTYWPWRGISIPAEVAEEDIGVIKELSLMNVNAVRVFFTAKRTVDRLHVSGRDAFRQDLQLIDRILDECKKYSVTAIIATDSFPIDDDRCGDKRQPSYWEGPSCIGQIDHLIALAAERYSSRGKELAAYQFMSEPVVVRNGRPMIPGNWNDVLLGMLKTIRQYDKQRYVIVSAGPWAFPVGYEDLPSFSDNYIIYNAHIYEPRKYTHQGIGNGDNNVGYPGLIGVKLWDRAALEQYLHPLIEYQKKHDVFVYIGEFSAVRWAPGHDRYLKDVIDICEQYKWSWTYFALGGKTVWTGWDPRYEASDGDSQRRLTYKGYDTDTWRLLKSYFVLNRRSEI